MNKTIATTLALLCATMQVAWAEATYFNGESGPMWEFNETTKTLTISGTGDMPNFSWNDKAPWDNFAGQIETVTIEDGITTIGELAFYWCDKLTSITIPSTVNTIGTNAFFCCKSLETLTIPGTVTSLGNSAFYSSGLKSIDIGDGVTELLGFTFAFCSELESITFGKGLKSIASSVFHDCQKLKNVNFAADGQLTSIGSCAFYRTGLESITLPNSLTTMEERIFEDCQSLEEVTFGTGITHIAFYSFTACTNLKRLTIPAGVVSMGAFFDNRNVEDVYCYADPSQLYWWSNSSDDFKPGKGTRFHVMDMAAWKTFFPNANVTYVEDLVPAGTLTYSVNQGVAHVTGITGPNPSGVVMIPATYTDANGTYPVTTIASEAFKDKTGLTSVSFPSVKVIAANAFEGCTGLTTLTLPSTLTSIGSEAFKGCTGLRSVVIDANFGGSLFAGCDNISAITFGDHVTSIGARAFQNLPNLTSVTIPANVQTIGGEAFDGCSNLSTITFLGTTPPETDGAQLYGIASNFAIRVPTGYVDAYRAHSIWGNKVTHIECMPWAGSGSESDPYLISHKDELDLIAKRVNEGNNFFETYFKVTKDITYDPTFLPFDNGMSNYQPIGNSTVYNSIIYDHYFWGCFDGDNHIISGIRIYSDRDDLALFGRAFKYETVIQNIILDDTQISGNSYIAGILGSGSCTVTNCHVTNRVIIGAINNYCVRHGGIAGATYGKSVNHCTSAAKLTIADGLTKHGYFGAITGSCWGHLNDNLVIGAIVPTVSDGNYGAISSNDSYYLDHNYYTACTVAGVENAIDVGGYDYKTVGDQTENDAAVSALRDDADNSTALGLFAALPATLDLGFGAGKYPMQLAGRTLYKDDSWNTLCLPFSLNAEQVNEQLDPLALMELDTENSGFDPSDGTLYLYFKDATNIDAGKPYIVKWGESDSHLVNPVFNGVSVTSTTPTPVTSTSSLNEVQFIGTYSSTPIEQDDKSSLYLGADNTLYYPSVADFSIGAFRAYFHVNLDSQQNIKAFNLNFGDEETGIREITTPSNHSNSYYTLDGRRIGEKPTIKGLYIHNGQKMLIK